MARLRVLLAVTAAALGWSVAIASPAAADPPKVTAAYDGSLCGVVVVTVTNPLPSAVVHVIESSARLPIAARVEGKSTKVERISVSDGDTVTFRGIGGDDDVEASDFRYAAPDGCTTGRLALKARASCVNLLVSVTNNGPTETNDLRVIVDGTVVIPAGRIAPDGAATGLFGPTGGDRGPFTVTLQQRAPADGAFFDMFSEENVFLGCDERTVDVTDTCTGVHVTAHTRPGDTLIVEAATGQPKRQEFDVATDPDEFDIDVASGTLLAIGYFERTLVGDSFDVAAFHRHVAVCPTTPAPSAPAGGGGGLPVTGTRPLAAAGAGAGLLVLGCAAVLLLQRRRTTFSA